MNQLTVICAQCGSEDVQQEFTGLHRVNDRSRTMVLDLEDVDWTDHYWCPSCMEVVEVKQKN